MPKKKQIKVFVAMSGGVDSSVAALLLKEQGYNVTGVYMRNWTDTKDVKSNECSSENDRRDALRVAAKLDIPLMTFDFQKEYRRRVVNYLFSEYKAGRTPNPDVMCNKHIKFGLFLKRALSMGADFIATGHYARVSRQLTQLRPSTRAGLNWTSSRQSKQILKIPKDKHKDQTYFLYTLNEKQLSRILFPLADLTKPEVRIIANRAGFHTAEKADSQGICFVGEVSIERFLRQKFSLKKGKVVDQRGNVIGEHHGAYFYTVGQRHGFCITSSNTNRLPYYIVAKDVKKNLLVVAPGNAHSALMADDLICERVHWISGHHPQPLPLTCKARIRHGQPLQSVKLSLIKSGRAFSVHFRKHQRAVAPGQSVVFYGRGGQVLGGGIITMAKQEGK
jgi:tRNA-specific 2-thiouridylase